MKRNMTPTVTKIFTVLFINIINLCPPTPKGRLIKHKKRGADIPLLMMEVVGKPLKCGIGIQSTQYARTVYTVLAF